jgi:hypothetical protein
LGEPWVRALEALRRAKVAPARRLRKDATGIHGAFERFQAEKVIKHHQTKWWIFSCHM